METPAAEWVIYGCSVLLEKRLFFSLLYLTLFLHVQQKNVRVHKEKEDSSESHHQDEVGNGGEGIHVLLEETYQHVEG